LVWVRDDPRRLEAHKAVILARTAERRAYCWRTMDGLVSPGRVWKPSGVCLTRVQGRKGRAVNRPVAFLTQINILPR
jgi:hypothetical protein